MANIIPPLLSNTPPPVGNLPDEDEDEFGDFRAADESYSCDNLSLPTTPSETPKRSIPTQLDINRNSSTKITENDTLTFPKDFQDFRKTHSPVDQLNSHNSDQNGLSSENCDILVNGCESMHISPSLCNGALDSNNELCEDSAQSTNLKNDVLLDSVKSTSQLEKKTELNSTNSIDDFGKDSKISDFDDFGDFESSFPPIKQEKEELDINHFTENAEATLNQKEPTKEDLDTNITELSEENTSDCINSERVFVQESNTVNFQPVEEKDTEGKVPEDDFNPKLEENSFAEFPEEKKEGILEEHEVFDDFTDFQANCSLEENKVPEEDKDSFDDFGEFESCQENKGFVADFNLPQEDTFGDFASASQAEFGDFSTFVKTEVLSIDSQNVFEKAKSIVKEMFPVEGTVEEEIVQEDFLKEDEVFSELRDISESNALKYQWPKSETQQLLLKALNIDTRNILYGPNWNPSLPRFAVNLGMAPLEPIKPEVLTPEKPEKIPSKPSQSPSSETNVPSANFDWSSSGLVNPLDYSQTVLLDLEHLVASLDIPNTLTNPDSNSPSEFDDWDIWLQIVSSEDKEEEKSEKMEDFGALQTTSLEDWNKLVPLRESYICNETEAREADPNMVWLQPTIVTPEPQRKEIVEDDDDFDDFQMVLPQENFRSEGISMVFDSKEMVPEAKPESPEIQDFKTEDDDEFTEFHTPVLPEVSKPVQPLQPVPLEPLKPEVAPSAPTLINWPDPGITAEELSRFEICFSKTSKEESSEPKPIQKIEPEKKEDDEWSDFVSVKQTQSPLKKSFMDNRTASPDLTLSVFNLGSLQPVKSSVPVITPQGLVQTKISSTHSLIQDQQLYKPIQQKAPFNQSFNTSQDDDDWSDFVSVRPNAPTPSNGISAQQTWSKANIITNPGSFDVFAIQEPVRGTSAPPKPISTISNFPDLEFIAPKGRTNRK